MNDSHEQHSLIRIAGERPFVTSLVGSILLLCSFPPVGFWPLAWVATIPLIALIATPRFTAPKPMRSIWFAGLIYWAIETYYISIPHPALYIAWSMLFIYLSVYPILFVWIGRKFVHDQRVSILIAAPVVFTALEWVRAHMLSGFGFSMLANSQYKSPVILQICDVAGGYGLTFLMVLVAAGIFLLVANRKVMGAIVSLAVLGGVFGYGTWQLKRFERIEGQILDVAVMQGCIDTRFPTTQAELQKYREQLATDYYQQQTEWQQTNDWPVPELIIWPEGKYPVPHYTPGGDDDHQRVRDEFRFFHRLLYQKLKANKKWKTTPRLPKMIVGTNTLIPGTDEGYNSAVLIDQQGRVEATYHKMHLVPFGEFVPFEKQFPFLAKATPIGSGFNAGKKAEGFQVGDKFAVPNVCFESAVSHLIRESVGYLRGTGREPDFLVNVTDDGWFYGHCLLDHHLSCNVMRAIENRKPMIVAANTGFSAFIQSTGEILKQGPRRESEVMAMQFPLKPARSLYSTIADWPAALMTLLCVLAIICPARKPKE